MLLTPFPVHTSRWGNKLSSKQFLAKKFVVKHIKTKFDDKIQAEKEKASDMRSGAGRGGEQRDDMTGQGGGPRISQGSGRHPRAHMNSPAHEHRPGAPIITSPSVTGVR